MKTAILIPCYRRPEYTKLCLDAIFSQEYKDTTFYLVDDNSLDGTDNILLEYGEHSSDVVVTLHKEHKGLRNTVIDFFEEAKQNDYEIIGKIDNDCVVPKGWLDDILFYFSNDILDALSPNVRPSNAAMVYGSEDIQGLGYRPTKTIGGLWFLKAELIKDIVFDRFETFGLSGAIPLLKQIVLDKEPRMGWITNVTVDDIGHWSGEHPDHIKSKEHEVYCKEVGRKIAWEPIK